MEHVSVFEPYSLTSLRVSGCDLPHLTCPQSIICSSIQNLSEFVGNTLFYFSSIRGLKNILPGKVHSFSVVRTYMTFLRINVSLIFGSMRAKTLRSLAIGIATRSCAGWKQKNQTLVGQCEE